ncbi:MAG: pyridoxamine 5'-phosphate oxidase [Gammaproteobacteria bacterium]|nr:pyridoxamine 5'-phosphate oxidase [Gammaproteobacteria bacterium]MBP7910724.1 pyridoxamine 5'-phosphate oxidase [Pseudomonadales bacterium]
MDLEDFRREYLAPGLHRKDLDASPFRQFESWLKHAIDAGLRDPTAMAVATVDARGRPSQRLVLLKHCDDEGFVFYTNLESRKAREIAGNPQVALLFPWADMERQVRIEGTVERMGAAQALKYFLLRPRASQLAAWASAQSRPLSSRALLEDEFARLKQKFGEGRIPLPSFWGGFRVVPDAFEFWQGRPNRLHDRFSYTLADDGHWCIERLAP